MGLNWGLDNLSANQEMSLFLGHEDIVTCISIARQRLDKHISAETNSRNTRTSIVRQRISKHASLTIKAVFSAWSMQSGYKKGVISEELLVRHWESSVEEVLIWGSCCQELGRVLEMAVEGDWEDFMCDLKLQWDGYKSVARIRLVKTKNPSACVTVNCKVCKISDSAVLPVVPSLVNKISVNPIIQSKNRHAQTPYTWQYIRLLPSSYHLTFMIIFLSCVLYELLSRNRVVRQL
jgi:hypothetical protein